MRRRVPTTATTAEYVLMLQPGSLGKEVRAHSEALGGVYCNTEICYEAKIGTSDLVSCVGRVSMR